jgi:U3 small nucleolar RNA-associated protein 22
MRAALGVQLAGALEAAHGLRCTATEAGGIEVLAEGFAFRLHLHSGREEPTAAAAAAARAAAAAAGAALAAAAQGSALPGLAVAVARAAGAGAGKPGASPPQPLPELLARSWHHGLIAGVANANPAFAPSVRLAQRWLGAHMLSNHLAPEAIELIAAAAFVGPSGGPAGGPAPPAPGANGVGSEAAALRGQQQSLAGQPSSRVAGGLSGTRG